jgi:hypothetical protein
MPSGELCKHDLHSIDDERISALRSLPMWLNRSGHSVIDRMAARNAAASCRECPRRRNAAVRTTRRSSIATSRAIGSDEYR